MGLITEFNHLEAAKEAINQAISKAVRKAAFDVEGQAKVRAAVDTGFMKSSIYAEMHDSSDYGGAGEPPAGAELLAEIPRAEDDHTAYVAVGASYGIYVEFGTVHMAAQPFMTPAADAVQPSFVAAMEKLEGALTALGI